MKAVSILSMRIKRGSPHIWVESIATRRAGFEPGVRFSVEMHGSGVLLRVDDDGDRLVSRKIRGASIMPVIDINSQSDLAPLSGHESARVVFGDRRIFISPLASASLRFIADPSKTSAIENAIPDPNVEKARNQACPSILPLPSR